MEPLVPALAPHLRVERNAIHWFRPAAAAPAPVLPVLVIEDRADHLLYAVPSMRALGDDLEDGVKFAAAPQRRDRRHRRRRRSRPSAADAAAIAGDVTRYLPRPPCHSGAIERLLLHQHPDGHFVIDRHPEQQAVVLASPCSGHGFKFAPVLGEALADLALDAAPAIDLGLFSLARLTRRRYSRRGGSRCNE